MSTYDTGVSPLIKQIDDRIAEKLAKKDKLNQSINIATDERKKAYDARDTAVQEEKNYFENINIFKAKIADLKRKINIAKNEAERRPEEKRKIDFSIMKYQEGIAQNESQLDQTSSLFTTSTQNVNLKETSLFNAKINVISNTSQFIENNNSLIDEYLTKNKFLT